jgi:predicted Fe-Mo cluster-binding NifX family protein
VNVRAAHGAGTQAAQNVVRLGVQAVVTGHVGPNAASALRAGNVKIYRQNWGTVRDAIEHFKSGRLPEVAGPTESRLRDAEPPLGHGGGSPGRSGSAIPRTSFPGGDRT